MLYEVITGGQMLHRIHPGQKRRKEAGKVFHMRPRERPGLVGRPDHGLAFRPAEHGPGGRPLSRLEGDLNDRRPALHELFHRLRRLRLARDLIGELFPVQGAGVAAGGGDDRRITSYNVCYTKLLR